MKKKFDLKGNSVIIQYVLCCLFMLVLVISSKIESRNDGNIVTSYQILDERSYSAVFKDQDTAGGYHYRAANGSRGTVLVILGSKREFLCTILFEDHDNGFPELRSEGEKMYIQLNNGCVFILSGTQIVGSFSYNQAEEAGYTSEWFVSQP